MDISDETPLIWKRLVSDHYHTDFKSPSLPIHVDKPPFPFMLHSGGTRNLASLSLPKSKNSAASMLE